MGQVSVGFTYQDKRYSAFGTVEEDGVAELHSVRVFVRRKLGGDERWRYIWRGEGVKTGHMVDLLLTAKDAITNRKPGH